MHSLNLDYEILDEELLLKILQIADLMDVPPKVAMKAWLLSQCDESSDPPSEFSKDKKQE